MKTISTTIVGQPQWQKPCPWLGPDRTQIRCLRVTDSQTSTNALITPYEIEFVINPLNRHKSFTVLAAVTKTQAASLTAIGPNRTGWRQQGLGQGGEGRPVLERCALYKVLVINTTTPPRLKRTNYHRTFTGKSKILPWTTSTEECEMRRS